VHHLHHKLKGDGACNLEVAIAQHYVGECPLQWTIGKYTPYHVIFVTFITHVQLYNFQEYLREVFKMPE